MEARRWLVLVLIFGISGCTQPMEAEPMKEVPPLEPVLPHPWAVVADGYGIPNFYHEAHRRPGWTDHPSARIPGFPADAQALNLTFGEDYDANLAADEGVWQDFQPGLYWVPGTNILYLHRSVYNTSGPMPESNLHASAVAGSVSEACPDCYYLAIRTNDSHVGGGVQIVVDELPWVDLVVQTTSIGIGHGFPEATYDLYKQGRLFFGPAGNSVLSVTPAPGQVGLGGGYADPPWIVSVSGSYEQCNAVDMLAAAPAEIVAQFMQHQPGPTGVTDRTAVAGTSFSAPTAAGIAGQVLFDIRKAHPGTMGDGFLWNGQPTGTGPLADGNLTNAELRQAMRDAAALWGTADADMVSCPVVVPSAPTPTPAAPWTKMGYGHVGTGTSQRMVEILLGDETEPPAPAAQAWYDAYATYRVERFAPLP